MTEASDIARREQYIESALERIASLEAERDRLTEHLGRLAAAEMDYRAAHDKLGGDHIVTGRAWDRMRRSGDVARNYIDGQSMIEHEKSNDSAQMTR